MHLIHVRLHTPRDFRAPEDLAAQFIAQATPAEGVEHVSVHQGTGQGLTVGLYVVAESLLIAEEVALAVSLRTVERVPALSRSGITSCSAALVGAYFDRLLEGPAGDLPLEGPGGDRLLGGPGGDRRLEGPGGDRPLEGPAGGRLPERPGGDGRTMRLPDEDTAES